MGEWGVGKGAHLAQSVARVALEKTPAAKVYFCPGGPVHQRTHRIDPGKNTAKFRRNTATFRFLLSTTSSYRREANNTGGVLPHLQHHRLRGGTGHTHVRPSTHRNQKPGDRLRSRFSGGLIVDIQEPDFELRTAILLNKAKEKEIELSIDAAKL
jgi:chromosomal replication initiator protein